MHLEHILTLEDSRLDNVWESCRGVPACRSHREDKLCKAPREAKVKQVCERNLGELSRG